MFPKHIFLFFALTLFAACSNAEPVQDHLVKEEPSTVNNVAETLAEVDTIQEVPAEKVRPNIEEPPMKNNPSVTEPEQSVPTETERETEPGDPEAEDTKIEPIEEAEPGDVTVREESIEEESTPVVQKLSHTGWDELLKKYVSSTGKVNYSGFKKDIAKLQTYLDLLTDNPIQPSWSRNEKMAYWINAYNAFTVKLIVDHYPIKSITKIHSGKPWSKKWIKLGDKTYSLDQIENEILRPQFKDARIHFAVNCAAQSCPPLLNEAWTAQNLEANFESQARKFINNPKFNNLSEKKVQISRIFEWYSGDFGDIIAYLNKYAAVKIKSNARVTYLEYDWALNE